VAGVGTNTWTEARRAAREARRLADAASGSPLNTAQALTAALKAAKLRSRSRPPNDSLLHGAHAVLDAEARTIWYRADVPPQESALLIAHELGHFHLHHHRDTGACSCDDTDLDDDPGLAAVGYGPRQRREAEANVWAREFLLPASLARQLFYDREMDAAAIARRLSLSPRVVADQLNETLSAEPADEPQAVVPPIASVSALDESQSAAARSEISPLLVGAGPGTGKTLTLTERVLFLVREQGVHPENILALTFSRKAADEMRTRIGGRDREIGYRTAISTFHAFGLDLLRRYWQEADLPPRPILLTDVEALTLLERRIGQVELGPLRYLHDPSFPLPDVLRAISRLKETLISPADFAEKAESLNDDKLRDVARLYAVYEALLREKGALDYADLICRALRLLQENESVRRAEQTRWRHVLVDEYQDVNRAGAHLVRLLTRDGTGLWAVGDLRQAIYAFRGASPANVARFSEDFPDGRRSDLAVNYRSLPSLVALFGVSCGEGANTWKSSRTAQTAATLAIAPDDSLQADGIARQMLAFRDAGHGFGDQVVLCRTRGQARQMRKALAERGLPVAEDSSENNLIARRDVRDLLALLSRVVDPEGPTRHRFPLLPKSLASVPGDAYEFFITALWGEYGLARRLVEPAAILPLLALARTFRERAPLLLEPSDDPRRAFLAHIRRLARLGISPGSDRESLTTDAVRVLTIHASKGLEFPVVFVPNLSAGKFPSRPAPSLLPDLPLGDDDEADEESRLFFVALTRARDHLIVSRAEKYNNRSAQPSPLLALLDVRESEALIERVRWDSPLPPVPLPSEGEGVLATVSTAASHTAKAVSAKALSGADAARDTNTPSPSEGRGTGGRGEIPAPDAELYLRCPRRYYYAKVKDLPTGDRSAYSAFRSAVQSALEDADPAAALSQAWQEKGPDPLHPHNDMYRTAAEKIVGRPSERPAKAAVKRRAENTAETPLLSLPLEHGTITVQPESLSENGLVVESSNFRRLPPEGDEVAPEMHQSLLAEAASLAAKGKPVTVRMRYLQTGEIRTVADKPKIRQKHLAVYDQALKGIGLRVWEPAPQEASECPNCPFFFLCPDE
jgi:superfamily I DNA/RNA helicase/Zn-dependent peptidase ImmA (M78 family)